MNNTSYKSVSEFILHLNLIDGVGQSTISRITNNYARSLSELAVLFRNKNLHSLSISEEIFNKIYPELSSQQLYFQELKLLEIHNARYVTPYDDEYPKNLQHYDHKPSVLYFQGRSLFNAPHAKYCAAIGSRAMTDYGISATKLFLQEIRDCNVIIVSGGAIGGDTIAHKTALVYGIPTMAVLGSGLAHWYPGSNKGLFKEIIAAQGMIVSPFTMNQEPHKGTFPARNVIIAALSDLIFIAQAGKTSGTLITAHMGLEMSKDIAVVPGRFDDELSQGCLELIKQGAHVVYEPKHLRDLLGATYVLQEESKKSSKKTVISDQEKYIFEYCHKPRHAHEILQLFPGASQESIQQLLHSLIINKSLHNDILGRYTQ